MGPSQNAVYFKDYENTSMPQAKKTNEEKETQKQPMVQADKIEISQEAKMLNSQNVGDKDLATIKERIRAGYYNSPEVIGSVADAILKETGAVI